MNITKHITDDEIKGILQDYYSSALTINDLAKKYHRSQYTVSYAIKEYGKGLKQCKFNSKKITNEQLIEEAKTLNCVEIARKYNMSAENVYRRAKKLGLEVNCVGGGGHYRRRQGNYNLTEEYDCAVTLKRVREKFCDICQICGKVVDDTDIGNGHIKKLYPSIDHIIPLSKGGTHTWDNVQLAHMGCNAGKQDRT